MKIYLAGKIRDARQWRTSIVDTARWHEKSYSHSSWEVLEHAVFGIHDYTGPYYAEHHNEGSVHTEYSGYYSDGDSEIEHTIIQNCYMAVCQSDLVFARFTDSFIDPTIGTIAEVAWAWHKRIPIVGYGDDHNLWFVKRMCTVWYEHHRGTEAEALRSYLKLVDYKTYIRSDQWKRFATSVKEARGNRCQVCNKQGALDAHHRTYERLGWEHPDDITVLCRDCHELYETNRRAKTGSKKTTKILRRV